MVSPFMVKEKVLVGVRKNAVRCGLFTGALGAFSFLWGENDELFGKHSCGGILTPVVRPVGLKDKRS